ncbi:mechanosensitive ion channel family protein [Halapricum hydrolyticum]|uniref:Mechanosensitive ion channel family protein n=1 Tax=Halapricum hydrolyticum TaxID=2979991 RepID=A0AAE3IEK4_9EURY|nr:mechanosensitive ion channel family protein [Halapricum hydrolyticum]MCU4718854.1 mechanosensitive ion channel family protein [Halapricum hydrolyticum]MCU4727868.1 mechanosensitive ion channel family protein [Halapricum hydrolyticum]
MTGAVVTLSATAPSVSRSVLVIELPIVGQLFATPTGRWLGTLAVLVGVLAGSWAIRQTGRWLRTHYDPRGTLLEAVQAALIVALSGSAIVAVLTIWEATAEATAISEVLDPAPMTIVRGLVSVFLLVGAWGATVFAKRVTGLLFEEHDAFSRHQHEVTYHVLQLVLYSLAIVVGLAVWGIDPSDILLGAGFLSVVIGLAARQTLSSVLAGFVLLFGRPFDIGDWVAIDDREGIVTDVSVFNTEIRTFSGEFVTIPNDVVTATGLVNRSRRGRLRVDVEVGVDYDDDVERARELATETMRDLGREEIRTHPQPRALLTGFGDSAVVLELRFWIDEPTARRRWAAQTAVVAAVKQAFEREGITIPFPQRTLGGRPPGLQVQSETPRGSPDEDQDR